MTPFQTLGIALTAALMALSAWGFVRRRLISSLLWLLLWGTAAVAIAWPDLTGRFAIALGIGRGADLVFYCGILGMLVGFFVVYCRLRQVDRQLTVLVRELALLATPPPAGDPPAGPGGAPAPADPPRSGDTRNGAP